MTKFEYRVRWQREGLRATSQIFQTEKGMREKARRLIEADGQEYDPFGPVPNLKVYPSFERRKVGPWTEMKRKRRYDGGWIIES